MIGFVKRTSIRHLNSQLVTPAPFKSDRSVIHTKNYSRLFLCIGLASLLACGCGTGAVPVVESGRGVASSKLPIEARIGLGIIAQGDTAQLSQWIQNESNQDIRISKIEKSCECLEVRVSKLYLQPKDRAIIFLSYNGTKDPDFIGELQIEVMIINENGENVGKIEVPVEVVSERSVSRWEIMK